MREVDIEGFGRYGKMVRDYLNITGTGDHELTILPFREYTSQFDTLHADEDCSHL